MLSWKVSCHMLGKNFCGWHFEQFFLFFPESIIDISYRLSPKEPSCMKCQTLLPDTNKKDMITLLSADFTQRVLKVISLNP